MTPGRARTASENRSGDAPDDLRAAITSAPMSAVLLVLNLTVFIAVSIEGRLLDVLALSSDWAGSLEQPWTLITVAFTAETPIHIAVAVLTIGVFGFKFERVAGSVHVLVAYLLAGLAGSHALVATAAPTGYDGTWVGASAAFLGLIGALAASPRAAWGAKLAVGKIVIVVLAIQLVAPAAGIGDWVSSAAHLAGLAVGAAYGYSLRPRTVTGPPEGASLAADPHEMSWSVRTAPRTSNERALALTASRF